MAALAIFTVISRKQPSFGQGHEHCNDASRASQAMNSR
jgi:hypothetical protein